MTVKIQDTSMTRGELYGFINHLSVILFISSNIIISERLETIMQKRCSDSLKQFFEIGNQTLSYQFLCIFGEEENEDITSL